jgi:hypothetical protein
MSYPSSPDFSEARNRRTKEKYESVNYALQRHLANMNMRYKVIDFVITNLKAFLFYRSKL